jgi:molybdopterin-guanine dinucleotide biosynthesis protein MobB
VKIVPSLLPVPIIAVVGSRKSGKTTAMEIIIKELASRGYRVAAVKHIHDATFTIDEKGKDTWKFAQAGAHIVVGMAARESAIITKTDTSKYTLEEITQGLESNADVILLEGFRDLVSSDLTVPKIVTVKNKEEIMEATRIFKPILAFTGPFSESEAREVEIPYINNLSEPGKLAEIIDRRIGPIIVKRRETRETLSININDKILPLNPYVQKVMRNVVFGVISTLKGATINGDENVTIQINKAR